jgi:hypothetical protein
MRKFFIVCACFIAFAVIIQIAHSWPESDQTLIERYYAAFDLCWHKGYGGLGEPPVALHKQWCETERKAIAELRRRGYYP